MRAIRWVQHVCASDLSWRAKCVSAVLGCHATGGDMPTSTTPIRRLAEKSGLSEATVHRAIRELVAGEWVIPLHRHRKACRDHRKCDGCAPTKWILNPVDSPVDKPVDNPVDNEKGVSHRQRGGVSQTPPRGVSQTPLKEKSSIKSDIALATIHRIGNQLGKTIPTHNDW